MLYFNLIYCGLLEEARNNKPHIIGNLTSDQNIYIPGISQNKNTFLHTLEKKKAVPSKIISHNSH